MIVNTCPLIIKCKRVYLAQFISIMLDSVYCSSLSRHFGVWFLSSKYFSHALPVMGRFYIWSTLLVNMPFRLLPPPGLMLLFPWILLMLGLPNIFKVQLKFHVFHGDLPQLEVVCSLCSYEFLILVVDRVQIDLYSNHLFTCLFS